MSTLHLKNLLDFTNLIIPLNFIKIGYLTTSTRDLKYLQMSAKNLKYPQMSARNLKYPLMSIKDLKYLLNPKN